jgi:G3E family GTPase
MIVGVSGWFARGEKRGLSRISSSVESSESASVSAPEKVPITLLSGFLGSGKTSTLLHLLENKEGVKIGVIVNDVASVNIDAKLVKENSLDSGGVLELQNGCACCSLADELMASINTILAGNNNQERRFDALVIELSGVADPMAIKFNWKGARLNNHPVTKKADLARVVTLVDASTFGSDWMVRTHSMILWLQLVLLTS